MSLSNILAKKPETPITEKYFTCLVEQSFVTLAIWGVSGDLPKVLSVGTPKEWQELSSLSDAIELGLEEFHEQAESVTSVLFSLPEEWVDDNDIKADYKEVLKKVTHKLALQPVGFVVSVEALFQYLFQYKTSAVRTLFFQLGSHDIQMYMTEHGRVIQKEKVGRSEQMIDDLIEGLSRLEKRPLPSQVYFFSFEVNAEQLDQDKQLFLTHNWEETGLFHHLPTIEIVNRGVMIEAACLTGGKETLNHKQPLTSVKQADPDFGFEEVLPETAASTKMSSFGVPMPQRIVDEVVKTNEAPSEPEYAIDDEEAEAEPKKKKTAFHLPSFKIPVFGGFKKQVEEEDITPELVESKPHRPKPRRKRSVLVVGGLVMVLLCAGVAATYGYVVSQRTATVSVTLKTIPIAKDVEIQLDPTIEETDTQQNILKVELSSKEVTDKEQSSTTGNKLVGEKAKGTVTILNKTGSLKTFAKNTELKSGNKVYLLDQDVTVASASTKENGNGASIEYGKKDISITAKDIGADFNVDKDTEFTVANFGKDTYSARNEDGIKGGSSRELQAVSKEDLQKLAVSLKKSLLEKAENELKDAVGEGEYVVLTGKSKVIKETYSAKLDDQTDTLSLEMTLSVEAYTYKSEDLKPIAKDQLVSLVPDGGVLLEDKVNILSKQDENATGSAGLRLNATLNSEYIPPTNSDSWLSDVQGKTIEQAKRILSEKAEIKSVSIDLSPKIAETMSGKLPDDKKKIDLKKKVE